MVEIKGCTPYGVRYCLICKRKSSLPLGRDYSSPSMEKYHLCYLCVKAIRYDNDITLSGEQALELQYKCEWCKGDLEVPQRSIHPSCCASCRSHIYNDKKNKTRLLESIKEANKPLIQYVKSKLEGGIKNQ